MTRKYVQDIHWTFGVSDETQSLFEKVANAPAAERVDILKDIQTLKTSASLSYALLALYRQQVHSGFVLTDPLQTQRIEEKRFFDPDTGIIFRLQWNPHRELRHDRRLLIQRGIIAQDVDKARLIHPDAKGNPCFLCKYNIERQNPGEILLDMTLAGEAFYAGVNFAWITNNHFTVINAQHQDPHTQLPSQKYRKKILAVLNDFIDKTGGRFVALFNASAGASIQDHEHLQVTTEPLPIQTIRTTDADVVYWNSNVRVSKPAYYLPLWVVEGRDKSKIETTTDIVLQAWHGLNQQDHTENLIAAKSGCMYRTFVILRDKNKLAGAKAGKKGAMAAFEAGGHIVLSHRPEDTKKNIDERQTFDKASLETVKTLLRAIHPDEQDCVRLSNMIRTIFGKSETSG